MASDSQQFERARSQWELLHEQSAYSVPAGIGRVAIVCSYYTAYGEQTSKRSHKDIKVFRKEALKLADILMEKHDIEVVLNAQPSDIQEILTEPSISDIVTIGHGNLSFLYLSADENGIFDWRDASNAADHLKTGTFTQRHCGIYSRDLSVPLGTFVVSDHRDVIAPLGSIFTPHGFKHPDNDLLQPVTSQSPLTYTYVKETFRYKQEPRPKHLGASLS